MSSDPKSAHTPSGLPTPKPSEEPEDHRSKADQKGAASEAGVKRENDGDHENAAAAVHQHPEAPPANAGETKENKADGAASDADARPGEEADMEAKRILACSDTSYAEILRVKPDSSEREKVLAWRRLGCLLHPESTYHDAAAFQKLRIAAVNLIPGVEGEVALEIEEVDQWDGKEDLALLDDEDKMDTTGAPDPVPSALVIDIYNKATPALYRLGADSTDPMALKLLQDLNAEISNFNAAEKEILGPDGAEISLERWKIPVGFFAPHYNIVQEKYKILEDDRTNEEARKDIAAEKELIDSLIERDHFPQSWTVLAADEYLQRKDKETATAGAVSPPADLDTIPYWWTTDKDESSIIIGVRKQGTGHRVLIGRPENGRTIYRLEAASEVGLGRVDQYTKKKGFKELAKGQSEWSYKDRDDFEGLLWVTRSQTKRKNTAAGKKDASADCCVKFKQKGIQILTLSSLRRVLGHGDANNKIEEVCERDGFPPPWKAGNISEFHDKSVLEKDPAKRRALADAQAAPSARNRLNQPEQSLGEAIKKENLEQLDDRLGRLENAMSEMKAKTTNLEQSMEELGKMFMAFMEKVTPILEKAK
ncbi:hypothetical protein CSUB01_11678 [Colletotrichum sublineola]|uniref:DnaJ domain-containing protein n=1 Tax=Colletotrichum sublineola TaxID=1173701 RepID=A0A066XSJ5_COLSU|nr:hypothetical protein CSUB01_11678 [Colletotrichum sublineola]